MGLGTKRIHRILAKACINRAGSGLQRTYRVEDSVFFDTFPSVIFSVAGSDTLAFCVVFIAGATEWLSAALAWLAFVRKFDTNSLHWLAIASAIP